MYSYHIVTIRLNASYIFPENSQNFDSYFTSKLKCHIITVPPSIIEKIEKFGKSFQKLTTDTVKGFLLDSRKSKFKV